MLPQQTNSTLIMFLFLFLLLLQPHQFKRCKQGVKSTIIQSRIQYLCNLAPLPVYPAVIKSDYNCRDVSFYLSFTKSKLSLQEKTVLYAYNILTLYTPKRCLISFNHSPLYLKNLGPAIEYFLPDNFLANAVNE